VVLVLDAWTFETLPIGDWAPGTASVVARGKGKGCGSRAPVTLNHC
jgi:hypothetical protein